MSVGRCTWCGLYLGAATLTDEDGKHYHAGIERNCAALAARCKRPRTAPRPPTLISAPPKAPKRVLGAPGDGKHASRERRRRRWLAREARKGALPHDIGFTPVLTPSTCRPMPAQTKHRKPDCGGGIIEKMKRRKVSMPNAKLGHPERLDLKARIRDHFSR